MSQGLTKAELIKIYLEMGFPPTGGDPSPTCNRSPNGRFPCPFFGSVQAGPDEEQVYPALEERRFTMTANSPLSCNTCDKFLK